MKLIHYTRIGATPEWLPEQEAWDHIRPIGFELHARVCRYQSWQDYGAMILRCEKYLGNEAHISRRLEKQVKVLHREKWSPWDKHDLHHNEAQKQFSKTVPPLELIMQAYIFWQETTRWKPVSRRAVAIRSRASGAE